MEVKLQVLVMLAMALSLFSAASATSGLSVYYPPQYYPAACPGFNLRNSGVMVAGVSDALWNGGKACGRMLRVRCTGAANDFPKPCKAGVITVKVVDYCRQPCNGVINLSQDAFARIANLDAGKVWVDYS
ncbi:hypothetical protein BT93_C0179 [Corymbia citriodora subsp. variegata]|nr:hypothetical protein BT93_C0179 [Corymbia citriodora subsp. variegata]